jgi:acetylornithine deacetylase/succinyl-diaminopimelate desuccinylase-like protein
MSAPGRETVAGLMPQLKSDLARLVAIPSISEWGFPEHTRPALLEAHQAVVELFRSAGVESFSSLELEGTAPVITGEIPGPDGAPTVLLYGHYDVVPAGDETLWTSPPFEASERDGAIFGRGAADSKANILIHVGALRAWEGRPPVGIKLLLEGQEEVGSPLEEGYPSEHPQGFRADAIVVADGGSIRAGQPSLTVSIRGDRAHHGRGADAREQQALRSVRRRRARRARRAFARPRLPLRRERGRGCGGAAAGGVER